MAAKGRWLRAGTTQPLLLRKHTGPGPAVPSAAVCWRVWLPVLVPQWSCQVTIVMQRDRQSQRQRERHLQNSETGGEAETESGGERQREAGEGCIDL